MINSFYASNWSHLIELAAQTVDKKYLRDAITFKEKLKLKFLQKPIINILYLHTAIFCGDTNGREKDDDKGYKNI